MAPHDRRPGFWPAFLLLTCFIWTGCASRYREPANSNNAATLTAAVPVWIASIDGKRVSEAGFTGEKQFRLSPGIHTLELHHSGGERVVFHDRFGREFKGRLGYLSKTNVVVSFSAEANHSYYVHDGRMDDRWRPFISEKPVATFLDLPIH